MEPTSRIAAEAPAGAPIPGRVLLAGVVGSTAYGLAGPDSDIDTLGTYLAPAEQILGLDVARAVTGSVVGHDPDVTYHELGKFCLLALAANPTVTELLWLTSHSVMTEAGARLIEARQAMVSTSAVRGAYLGYASNQARRLQARHEAGKTGFGAGGAGRVAKHARHCMRLLRAGEELLTTGTLTVNVAEARDAIYEAGELAEADPERFNALFEAERDRIEALPSVLADRPDRERVNAIVIDARRQALR